GIEGPCKQLEPPGSPGLPGEGLRDRLDLPTGTLVDIAGNMREWTRDVWSRIDEGCWAAQTLIKDPLCTTPSPNDGPLGVHRGGNWAEVPTFMVASARYARAVDFANIQTGFRCVWQAQ